VLFVHGIGEQPRGSTLRQFVDPLVRSLDLWLYGAARCRAEDLGQDAANAWAQAVPADGAFGESSTTIREKAHEMAWSADWNLDSATEAQRSEIRASAFWSGGAVLTDGDATADGEAPPHALLHVHTLGERHEVNEGTALLAECWWARAFAPTSPWTLLGWTFRVFPFALSMHFGDVVRRRLSGVADAATPVLQRVTNALLALLALAFLVVGVPLLAPLVLALLLAVSVLSVVPVGAVRDAVISLQSVILGALGDSCLLVDSPVSRAMIVGRCRRDLRWLCDRCERVMVVAHSQGCAVSHLALGESPPEEVREVQWIGSGLRKLECLRDAERDLTTLAAGWYAVLMPWVLWSQFAVITESGLSQGAAVVLVVAVAAWLFGLVRPVLVLRAGATALTANAWQARGIRLTEVYATGDPVPMGPTFDMTSGEHVAVPGRAVHNRASWLRDHTAYWRNVEQVVLPLGLQIAASLGVPVDGVLASDPRLRDLAVRRRIHRIRVLIALRCLAIAGGVALLWLESGALVQAVAALGSALQAPFAAPAIGVPSVQPALAAMLPILGWIALPYAALSIAWRGWEAHEQRRFLLRCAPGVAMELVLVVVMVAAAAIPGGRAAAVMWGDPGAGTALASILVGSVFAAVFYVLSLQVPKRAFGFDTSRA
jgi:uncharacterized membrane protein